jgi:hypothetical protein
MTQPDERARRAEVAELERFAKLSYRGRAVAIWESFMKERIRLAGCYQPAVAKVLGRGKWRDKAHPLAWVRRAAEAEAVTELLGSTGEKLRPLRTISDSLIRNEDGKVMSHDEKLDFYQQKESGFIKPNRRTYGIRHADDLSGLPDEDRSLTFNAKPASFGTVTYWVADYEDREYRKHSVDWHSVYRKAGLDFSEERVFEMTKLRGLSREKLIDMAPDDRSRKEIQAAARRLSRKMQSVFEAVRSLEAQADAPTAPAHTERTHERYIAPWEALRRLAGRNGVMCPIHQR